MKKRLTGKRSLLLALVPLAAVIGASLGVAAALSQGEPELAGLSCCDGPAPRNATPLYIGRPYELRYDVNGGTGYRWRVTAAGPSGRIAVVSSRYAPVPGKSQPGAPAVQLITVAGLEPGRAAVRVQLFPPGRGAKPAQTLVTQFAVVR